MKLAIASLVLATVGLVSSPAHARSYVPAAAAGGTTSDAETATDTEQPAAPSSGRADSACAKARAEGRICQIDIDGITVDGDRPGGDGTMIAAAMWASHGSLIRLRRDFIDAIVQSAEDIE